MSRKMGTIVYLTLTLSVIAFVIGYLFIGDGGFEKMTTLSGIYAVDSPSGYPVTCFVERGSGDMSCVRK